ncbi:MAG: LytR C-terminal domain-containing protein [Gemmatimonadota bacterium]
MRRRRRESLWPLAAVLGLIAIGLGVGALVPGGLSPEDAARALEVDPAYLPGPEDRIRVEVLNAGGIPGMAGLAKDHLRDRGFDVVYFGNAATFDREVSVVLGRIDKEESAAGVAEALGIAEVRSEPDPTRLVDVTVLLGSDWTPDPEEES